MEIGTVFHIIKKYLSLCKKALKEAFGLPYAKTYIFLSVVMTVVFVFATFPYEILIRNQISNIEHVTGGHISLGEIDFSLIGDSYIDELSFSGKRNAETVFKNVTFNIALNPFTTLLQKTIRGNVSIQNIRYEKRSLSVRSLLVSDFDIHMNSETGLPGSGHIKIKCDNVYVKGAKIKGFSIPPVRFTAIKGDATIKDSVLHIPSIKFLGSDLNGTIKGTFELNRFLKSSRINLTISINAESRILEDYKLLLSNFIDKNTRQVTVLISGRASRPRIQFPSMSSPSPAPGR